MVGSHTFMTFTNLDMSNFSQLPSYLNFIGEFPNPIANPPASHTNAPMQK